MARIGDGFFSDYFGRSGCPDLTIRAYGCEVHYEDTSTPEKVSYELSGMTLFGTCPDCESPNLRDKGSYLKCMNCGARLTMEYLESRIITSG